MGRVIGRGSRGLYCSYARRASRLPAKIAHTFSQAPQKSGPPAPNAAFETLFLGTVFRLTLKPVSDTGCVYDLPIHLSKSRP